MEKTLNRRTFNYWNGSSEKAIFSISTRDQFDWNKEEILQEQDDLFINIEADIVLMDIQLLDNTQYKNFMVTFIPDLV